MTSLGNVYFYNTSPTWYRINDPLRLNWLSNQFFYANISNWYEHEWDPHRVNEQLIKHPPQGDSKRSYVRGLKVVGWGFDLEMQNPLHLKGKVALEMGNEKAKSFWLTKGRWWDLCSSWQEHQRLGKERITI